MFSLIKKIIGLFRKNVYYIHSNNLLPPPLNEVEERQLIDLLPEMASRNKLIEHNLRLVVYIAKKFEGTKINIEDLISIGSLGLIKGVQTFKSDKNIKLATYCSRCIENEILMYLRKTNKLKLEVSLDETLNVDRDGNELLLADVLGTEGDVYHALLDEKKEEAMYKAINNLKPREKEIITLRFGLFNYEMLTQREVALMLGISQSYISRLEKRIIAKLKHELECKMQLK